jgi:hypothetical protein
MNNLHSQFLLRRFSFDKMKEDIDNIVNAELSPCEFSNADIFIDGVCNILAYRYFEDSKLSDKESEKLFPSIVNLFGEHLTKVYNKRCGKGLSESVKKIIIPENKLEEIVFKYLDTKLKDVKQLEGQYFDVIFKLPGYDTGIIGYNDLSNVLNINGKLLDDVFSIIPIEKTQIMRLIANYVVTKYRVNITRVMNPVLKTDLWR